MKIKKLIILLSLSITLLLSYTSTVAAELRYHMLKSTGNACPTMINYLNNYLNGSSSEELEDVKLLQASDTAWVKLPSGISRQPIEVDFDNDGNIDHVFQYDEGGSYICGTILYVVFDVKKKQLRNAKNLSISDVNIFPCQFDKRVSGASSCPTMSQGSDEAGIKVSINNKEVFFRGRYTDITPVRYKDKTYLILRSVSDDTKMYGAVIEPSGGTGYISRCLFKRNKK